MPLARNAASLALRCSMSEFVSSIRRRFRVPAVNQKTGGFARNLHCTGARLFHTGQPMGAQWKQSGREINAQKKGQMTAKLVREIIVAAKLGGPDPDLNPRLFAAVEKAKKASVYRDTIERAIRKGAGLTRKRSITNWSPTKDSRRTRCRSSWSA